MGESVKASLKDIIDTIKLDFYEFRMTRYETLYYVPFHDKLPCHCFQHLQMEAIQRSIVKSFRSLPFLHWMFYSWIFLECLDLKHEMDLLLTFYKQKSLYLPSEKR